MRKHVAVITFCRQDELYFQFRFDHLPSLVPHYYPWSRCEAFSVEEKVCLLRCAGALRLMEEVPLVSERLKEKKLLAIVYKLEKRLLVLQSLPNVNYVEESCPDSRLQEQVGVLEAGGRELDRRVIHLTERERQICQMLALGSSSQEISEALSIAVSTVNAHKRHIFEKFHVHTTPQLFSLCRDVMICYHPQVG